MIDQTQEKQGYALLQNCATNKSTAFTPAERKHLKVRGLLPYKVNSQTEQMTHVMTTLRNKSTDLERYGYLMGLQSRNENLFYKTVMENVEEIMPLIYTPTVGQACKEYSYIFRKPKGFFVSPDDRGNIREMLDNWYTDDVRVIVVTDGQRILGLGDLGTNGMGIPIGKLALYSACAGISPQQCMPIMFDAGTNNEDLLNDPMYLGYPHKRLEGDAYYSLMDEFITAVKDKFPSVLLQFEDFSTPNAYKLLDLYRDKILSFNDDIQGTAAVAVTGVFASTRITNIPFKDLKIMFLGAGSASTGIGELLVSAFKEAGLSEEQARDQLFFNDREGLITTGRETLTPHGKPFAKASEPMTFLEAVKTLKPQVLIGATGSPGTFNKEIVEAMCENTENPTIFALSNPTSRAECTAEEAYEWSKGKAIFASGSPFPETSYNGQKKRPGQGNNAYIFPGVGLGAIAVNASIITDEMFLASAHALAQRISETDLETGTLYPRLTNIRSISVEIAVAVAEKAIEQGFAIRPQGDLKAHIEAQCYNPEY